MSRQRLKFRCCPCLFRGKNIARFWPGILVEIAILLGSSPYDLTNSQVVKIPCIWLAFSFLANFHHFTTKKKSSVTHTRTFVGGGNEPMSPDFKDFFSKENNLDKYHYSSEKILQYIYRVSTSLPRPLLKRIQGIDLNNLIDHKCFLWT